MILCSKLQDIAICDTAEKQKNALLLLELLTPIAKTYPAEMGKTAISNGLQILGGYGYCMDFILQQYSGTSELCLFMKEQQAYSLWTY